MVESAEIRYVGAKDKEAWFKPEIHLTEADLLRISGRKKREKISGLMELL